jgi:hypothetical protein
VTFQQFGTRTPFRLEYPEDISRTALCSCPTIFKIAFSPSISRSSKIYNFEVPLHPDSYLLSLELSDMATTRPPRVLRMAGSYFRKEGVSEEAFHAFCSGDHAIKAAAIHERYGILSYQVVSRVGKASRLPSYLLTRCSTGF